MRRVEIGLLVGLCLFLPLYEAPKNVLWLLYLLVWASNRVRAKEAGGPWDTWDTLIAAWIASGFVVGVFGALHRHEWGGALDLMKYGAVLWMAKRSRFSDREIGAVTGALVAATLIGLAQGFVRLYGGTAATLELNSVGHVNHTAIYLAIILGLCVSWVFTWRHATLACVASVVILVALFVTASRGALAAALVMVLVLAAAWWPRRRWPLLASVIAVALALALAVAFDVQVIRKHEANVQAGVILSYRDQVWQLALDTWRAHPWFGVGMDNFQLVTAGRESDPNRALYPHAHNLYLGALAERGLVGAAPLAAVLVAWVLWLVRRRPRNDDGDWDWLLWGAAAGAWLITALAGTVNTTLHDEHGLLAALLLGLWLSRVKTKG